MLDIFLKVLYCQNKWVDSLFLLIKRGLDWWRSSLFERGHFERVRRLNAVKHCDVNNAVTQMRTYVVIISMHV